MWNNVTSKEWGKPSSELCPCSEAICENYCTTCYFQLKIKFRLVYNIWAGCHLVTVAKCPNIVLDDLINSQKTGHLSSLQKKLESHCHSVWFLCMNLTPITQKINWRKCSSFLSQEKLKRCGIRRDFERATNIECLCSRQKTNIWRRNWILQTVCVKWISVLFVSPENDSFAIGTFYWPWKCQHLNRNTNSNFSTNIKFEFQV